MDGKTHRLGGIVAGTALTAGIMLSNTPIDALGAGLIVISSAFASLLPDLDHPNSIASHRHKLISKFVRNFTEHRGFTHTLLCGGLLTMFIFLIGLSLPPIPRYYIGFVTIGFLTGYLSHLLLDIITPAGLAIFAPVSNYTVRIIGVNQQDHKWIVRIVLLLILGVFVFIKKDALQVSAQNLITNSIF